MSAAQHDQLVSGLDWCHAHNKIVTCSHDRNAFVFTLDESRVIWITVSRSISSNFHFDLKL